MNEPIATESRALPGKPLLGRPPLARWVQARIYVAAVLLTTMFGLIAYKAYGLQLEEGQRYRDLAARQHIKTMEVPAPRGPIYDRTGKELAVSAEIDSVFANPREIEDVRSTAEALAGALGLTVGELEQKLAAPVYFVWIKRHVTPKEAHAVRELALPGVSLTDEPRRFYPSARLAGPVLGFAGIDGVGLDGIELVMDGLLSGQRARVSVLRDASGTLMPSDHRLAPEPGASVTLTLDRYVQFVAERALNEVVELHHAKAGVAVVIEVESGEILAIANTPGFDPNSPAAAVRSGARNRAISDVYEIGSIMKIFTIAAALEARAVRPATVIDVENGRIQIGRKVIRDSYRDQRLTIGGIIKRSSNVGVIKVARILGKERLHAALLGFGFAVRTDIELPGERSGFLRQPDRWGETGLAAVSFGYGMTVTPLQVTAALAAIGNGGIYREPRLIAEVRSSTGKLLYQRRPAERRILSEQTAQQLLPMLGSVFDRGRDGGTARSLVVDGFRAGGKSGTAKKVDPTTRKYSDHRFISSFAGLAPIEDPKIAVMVMVDEPGGERYYGADVAGPAFTRIVSETLRYLGVPSDAPTAQEATEPVDGEPAGELALPIEDADAPIAGDDADADAEPELTPGPGVVDIPDVSGMGMARALDTAAELGIPVAVEGSGRAVEQTPAPGRRRKPAELRIVFSNSR